MHASRAAAPCTSAPCNPVPLTPPPAPTWPYSAGLALFCTVPTTLGVGISLVRSCKGNEALALFLTVVTNIVAIFLMPLWLKALFGSSQDLNLHVDVGTMFAKLVVTVLVPAVVGKVRSARPSRDIARSLLLVAVLALAARDKAFLGNKLKR